MAVIFDSDSLQESLSAHFPAAVDWELSLIKTRGEPEAMSLVMAKSPSSTVHLAIKGYEEKSRTQEQFDALNAIYQSGVCVARPHYIDEAARFFVMDWIDAPVVRQALGGANHDAIIFNAGHWLAQYQAATRWPTGSTKLKIYKPAIESSKGDEQVDRIARALACRARRHVFPRSGLVKLHGDFHLGNLFQTASGLVAIDPQYHRYGMPFQDPACFLIHLAIARRMDAASGKFWPGSAESDRRQFFSGFGAVNASDVALFDLVEDVACFMFWRKARELTPKGSKTLALTAELDARGLCSEGRSVSRPGRLIACRGNRQSIWDCSIPAETLGGKIWQATYTKLAKVSRSEKFQRKLFRIK